MMTNRHISLQYGSTTGNFFAARAVLRRDCDSGANIELVTLYDTIYLKFNSEADMITFSLAHDLEEFRKSIRVEATRMSC